MKQRFLHVWHGIDQTVSLTMQLMSGMDVFAHVCNPKAETSINYCDKIQPYDKRRFSFCQMWQDFYIVIFGNYDKFELLTFTKYCGNVLKVWWQVLNGFAGNLLLFPAVKEFRKSVKSWQSYRHEFGVLLFGPQSVFYRTHYHGSMISTVLACNHAGTDNVYHTVTHNHTDNVYHNVTRRID